MTDKPRKCMALNCDETLPPDRPKYCSNRCKQAVKYAVKTGRQCKQCGSVITKPKPVMGGFNQYCRRTAACREKHDAVGLEDAAGG